MRRGNRACRVAIALLMKRAGSLGRERRIDIELNQQIRESGLTANACFAAKYRGVLATGRSAKATGPGVCSRRSPNAP